MSEDQQSAAVAGQRAQTDAVTSDSRRRRWGPWRQRIAVLAVAVAVLAVAMFLLLRSCQPPGPNGFRVIAVGDSACQPDDPNFNNGSGQNGWCYGKAVSDLALTKNPQMVWGLGDYQYEVPTLDYYVNVFAKEWGRLSKITEPAVGNQEYKVQDARPYVAYFLDKTRSEHTFFYSYDIGSWHVIVLNSNCTIVAGGCGPDSPQVKWLHEDLAANHSRCIAAYWHHPRWSTGINGSDNRVGFFAQELVNAKADIMLSGHEADYERFPPLDAAGNPSPDGVRQFVVGTGGQVMYTPVRNPGAKPRKEPPREAANFISSGFLELTLYQDHYDFDYRTVDDTITDSGSTACHQR
jgi:hypothetical protein